MSFLRSLLARLGLAGGAEPPGPAPSAPAPADLRAAVEAAVESDDTDRLAAVLNDRREEGKLLIRQYEREVEGAGDDATRGILVRRLTALVAVYASAFEDREPLQWFRREGEFPEFGVALGRLERAKELLGREDFDGAARESEAALHLLESVETSDSKLPALRSALHALLAWVALRGQDLATAADHFDRSLAHARDGADEASLASALLNRIDFDTKRGMFAESIPLMKEAEEAAAGTPLEDVWAKIVVERGIGLMRIGELAPAESTFDHAIRLRPDWPFPHYQRAWTRFAQQDSSGALEDFRATAARAQPFFTVRREIRCLEDVASGVLSIDAYRAFCAVRERVREKPDAVDDTADRLLADFPAFAPAHLMKAEVRLLAGDGEGAREHARRALLHDPDPDTASAALFLEWNAARATGDEPALAAATERLVTAYRDSPAAHVVKKFEERPGEDLALRWTWSLDGKLIFQEGTAVPRDGKAPPPDPA